MATLFDYIPRDQAVTETSKASYKEVCTEITTQAQVGYVENILRKSSNGITDWELREQLKGRGVNIPLSSVAARRNDVNKKYAKLYSHQIKSILLLQIGNIIYNFGT